MTKPNKHQSDNWLDTEIDFYDFIWAYGVEAHNSCINAELIEDFKDGGSKFEEMKQLILKRFPTRGAAVEEFSKSREKLRDNE